MEKGRGQMWMKLSGKFPFLNSPTKSGYAFVHGEESIISSQVMELIPWNLIMRNYSML
jgi:hypothetical protein